MRQPTIPLRRARCLVVHWRGNKLFFHNFATRLSVSAKPLTCEVLDFFNSWRTSREAVIHFAGSTPRSVRAALAELVQHGLLLPKDSPELTQDTRIAEEWSAWLPAGSFHFATKDTPYIDRSRWNLNRLKSMLPKTAQPGIFKTLKGTMKVSLPKHALQHSQIIGV